MHYINYLLISCAVRALGPFTAYIRYIRAVRAALTIRCVSLITLVRVPLAYDHFSSAYGRDRITKSQATGVPARPSKGVSSAHANKTIISSAYIIRVSTAKVCVRVSVNAQGVCVRVRARWSPYVLNSQVVCPYAQLLLPRFGAILWKVEGPRGQPVVNESFVRGHAHTSRRIQARVFLLAKHYIIIICNDNNTGARTKCTFFYCNQVITIRYNIIV